MTRHHEDIRTLSSFKFTRYATGTSLMNDCSLNDHLLRDADAVIDGLGEQNQRFDGKTILLTGAAGFLGAHFLHYFHRLNERGVLSNHCKVTGWDNFIRGTPRWLTSLQAQTNSIQILERDIVNDTDFVEPDYIIHAASIASPLYYRKHPLKTLDANVTGLRNLLELTRRISVTSMLSFSTSEIYGDPDPGAIPTPETYRGFVSSLGPRACYDESKRFGETLCVVFHREFETPIKIVRPFNNYGPGLKLTDRRVIPDFFRNILQHEPLTLLSDGAATRTFCYISDAIEGYIRVLLSSHNGEAFNIGNDQPEISMLELARLTVKISDSNSEVIHQTSSDPAYLEDNPQRRCPDLTKSKDLLGYAPRIGLEEGLLRTLAYYQDHVQSTED